ncbi:MAG: UDP-N-acetylmuramate dehydrogenase [Calditrichia bacterium]
MKYPQQRKGFDKEDLKWIRDEPLAPWTTFHVGGCADYFVAVRDSSCIPGIVNTAKDLGLPLFLLSGGSNVLISDRGYSGVIMQLQSQGITVQNETAERVTLAVRAGENWDAFVQHCVSNGWWGLENLSHIPGMVGAAVIQNIGAYGSEISNAVASVDVFDRSTGEHLQLKHEECGFSYRKSIFNTDKKGRFIILQVYLSLEKNGKPQLGYRDLTTYFHNRFNSNPTQEQVRQAIIAIRNSKFPFPATAKGGNAGSFFKNLQVSSSEFERVLRILYDSYGTDYSMRLETLQKTRTGLKRFIPTALLMDALGLKNTRIGGAYINPTQPLVILNSGSAASDDIMRLFKHVRQQIFRQFELKVPNEPELVGFTKQEYEAYFEL